MLKNILQFFRRKKAKRKRRSYEDNISKAALANNSLSITEINDVEILKTVPLEEGLYDKIAEIIKTGNIELIKQMPDSENIFEDLTIIQFADQTGQKYAAIIYDSYELWEDPVVVEVFKIADNRTLNEVET
jgi:hypothetical protein